MIKTRWMHSGHLEEVLQIEKSAFTNPWTEQDFLSALRQKNCIAMVAVDGYPNEMVLGFVLYELHDAKLVIINMASKYHRCGVGRIMVNKLKAKLSPSRRHTIETTVRDDSLTMQLFLRSLGFKAVSVLRRFFNDDDADGYVMQYALPVECACSE